MSFVVGATLLVENLDKYSTARLGICLSSRGSRSSQRDLQRQSKRCVKFSFPEPPVVSTIRPPERLAAETNTKLLMIVFPRKTRTMTDRPVHSCAAIEYMDRLRPIRIRASRPVSRKAARYMSRMVDSVPAYGVKLVQTVIYGAQVPLISESILTTYEY